MGLDVDFQEDLSQISTKHAAENLSILRRLTLNVIRLDPDKKKSLKGGERVLDGIMTIWLTYLGWRLSRNFNQKTLQVATRSLNFRQINPKFRLTIVYSVALVALGLILIMNRSGESYTRLPLGLYGVQKIHQTSQLQKHPDLIKKKKML